MLFLVSSIPFTQRIHQDYKSDPDKINAPQWNSAAGFRPAKTETKNQIGAFKSLQKHHGKKQRVYDVPMHNKIKLGHLSVNANYCRPFIFYTLYGSQYQEHDT
jgi:hypothetical protein